MAAKTELQPVMSEGWLSGFGNFLRKEFSLWWSTWRWAKQLLLWTAIINGIVFLVMLSRQEITAGGQVPVLTIVNEVFLKLGIMATAVGAVVVAQDAIIGERQSGTAAWILSKPVARPAFLLAKFVAHTVSMVALTVVAQAVVYLLQVRLWIGETPELLPFATALGLWALTVTFYIALALMMGTFFHARAAVAGAGLGFLFAGQFVPNLSMWVYQRAPWFLADLAGPMASGQPVPFAVSTPILVTAALIAVLLTVGLWKFQREEL